MPKAPVFELGVPVLGICYGLQYMSHALGGKVEDSTEREYGKARLGFIKEDPLFSGLSAGSVVWMSHGDRVASLPKQFIKIGQTENSPYAVVRHKTKPFWGSIPPEVHHTKYGKKILENFCKLSNTKRSWSMSNFARQKIAEIQQQVGKDRVLLGLSGGVDSTVTARLIHQAIALSSQAAYTLIPV